MTHASPAQPSPTTTSRSPSPAEAETCRRLSRWLLPLEVVSAVLLVVIDGAAAGRRGLALCLRATRSSGSTRLVSLALRLARDARRGHRHAPQRAPAADPALDKLPPGARATSCTPARWRRSSRLLIALLRPAWEYARRSVRHPARARHLRQLAHVGLAGAASCCWHGRDAGDCCTPRATVSKTSPAGRRAADRRAGGARLCVLRPQHRAARALTTS